MSGKKKPLVVITRKLPDPVETRMRELFDARLNIDDRALSQPELVAAVREADVLVPTINDRIDAALIAQAGDRLKLIANFGNGVDNIDVAAAAAEADAIDAIVNKADLTFLTSNFVPADQLLQIGRHVLLGRIAQQKGYANTAIDEFRHAANLQDSLPYMEPPFWYYPVRQSLGAALLMANRPEEAAEVFKAALKQSPGNGWVIYGLKEAQTKLGDEAGAKESEAALAKAWAGSPDMLALPRL